MPVEKRGDFDLDKTLRKFKRKKKTMPRIIAKQAVNFFKDSFRKGGFTDATLVIWPKRFKRLPRGRIDRRTKERANLIGPGTGHLRRSVQTTSATFHKIAVGTRGIRYAERHNEGLAGMPKRQYIGNSRILVRDLQKTLEREIDKVF